MPLRIKKLPLKAKRKSKISQDNATEYRMKKHFAKYIKICKTMILQRETRCRKNLHLGEKTENNIDNPQNNSDLIKSLKVVLFSKLFSQFYHITKLSRRPLTIML